MPLNGKHVGLRVGAGPGNLMSSRCFPEELPQGPGGTAGPGKMGRISDGGLGLWGREAPGSLCSLSVILPRMGAESTEKSGQAESDGKWDSWET